MFGDQISFKLFRSYLEDIFWIEKVLIIKIKFRINFDVSFDDL